MRARVGRDLQFVRTTSSYNSWAPAIISFVKWALWNQIAIVASSEGNLFTLTATDIIPRMEAMDLRVVSQQLRPGAPPSHVLEPILAMRTTVVMVMARQMDLMHIALAARDMGMMTEGYAWLGLDSVGEAFQEALNPKHSRLPAGAEYALNGWVYFVAYSGAPASFYKSVLEATRSDFPQFFDGFELDPVYASSLYDAILLYATAVYNNPAAQDDASRMVDTMINNVSFEGILGRVDIDAKGDMIQSISVWNIWLSADGIMVQHEVGLFNGTTQKMTETSFTGSFFWPGGMREAPMDSALSQESFTSIRVLIGCLCGAAGLVVVLVVLIKHFSERFKHFLNTLVFEVIKNILTLCTEGADFSTDAISFHRAVLANSLDGAYQLSKQFKIAYSCFFASAVIASLLSFVYRGYYIYWKLLKAAMSQSEDQFSQPLGIQESSSKDAMLAKLRWEAEKQKRDLVGNLVTLLTAAFEDVRRRPWPPT